MSHERPGATDEWYTPKYIFDALGIAFDLDVAGDINSPHQNVPASRSISELSLLQEWSGLIWMNPPFGGRNALLPWIDRFVEHGNGIALVPDRSSAPWWQKLAAASDAVCFVSPKVQFIDENGKPGACPANGTTLHAIGNECVKALANSGLGVSLFSYNHTQD